MTMKSKIIELLLKGYHTSEIVDALPGANHDSLRNTMYRVMREDLSPEQLQEVRRLQAERPKIRMKRKSLFKMDVISNLHATIGAKLYMARMELRLKHNKFCEQFGFSSPVKVSLMEQGRHDFTLMEIQKIASIIGISFEELTNGLPARTILPDDTGSSQDPAEISDA